MKSGDLCRRRAAPFCLTITRSCDKFLTEDSDRNRITLSLRFQKSDDKKATIKSGDKKKTIKTAMQKEIIIEYLTDHAEVSIAELSDTLGVKTSRLKNLIYDLIADDLVVPEVANRNRRYRMKS